MSWIKPYYKVTLREYHIMESAGIISQYKEWYNFLPAKWFSKQVVKVMQKLKELLNDRGIDDETYKIENLKWQTESLLKINAVRNGLLAISNILESGVKLKTLTETQPRRVRRKLKFNPAHLAVFIEDIKKFSGMEITCLDDVKKVDEHLQFMIDKFNDMTSKQSNEPDEKIYLMDLAASIFFYLNQTINVNLSIVEFLILREQAEKKSLQNKTE